MQPNSQHAAAFQLFRSALAAATASQRYVKGVVFKAEWVSRILWMSNYYSVKDEVARE